MPASAAVKMKAEGVTLSRRPRETFCPRLCGGSTTSAFSERNTLKKAPGGRACSVDWSIVWVALAGVTDKEVRDTFVSGVEIEASSDCPSAFAALDRTNTRMSPAALKGNVMRRGNLLASPKIRGKFLGEF